MKVVPRGLELMAGNTAEAERILRDGRRRLIEIGSTGPAGLLAAMHAQSLYQLGRYADADEAAIAGWDDDPNDVQVNGRKVAGILAEAREGRVVLGIGVNVNVPAEELPQEVETPATSLLVEAGSELDRAELLAVLLERLEQRYDAWLSGGR